MTRSIAPVASSASANASRRAAAPAVQCRSRAMSSAGSAFRGASAPLRMTRSKAVASKKQVAIRAQGDRLELDPDNASILVCGGSGVALDITRKLKNMGSWVWMLQRTEANRKEIEGMMAIVSKGDALDTDSVAKAFEDMEEVDAVITTIGGTTQAPEADSQGNINLIEAALKKGVRKFIMVSSIGAGDSKDATPPEVYDVLKPVLLEKEKAEAKLQESADKMTFVIIRPGGLKSDAATGNAVLTESNQVCGAVTRADVANLTVKALFSDAANNKILSCIDQDMIMESSNKEYEVFTL